MTMLPPELPRDLRTDREIGDNHREDVPEDEAFVESEARGPLGLTIGAIIVAAAIILLVWYLVASDPDAVGETVDIAPDPVQNGIDLEPVG